MNGLLLLLNLFLSFNNNARYVFLIVVNMDKFKNISTTRRSEACGYSNFLEELRSFKYKLCKIIRNSTTQLFIKQSDIEMKLDHQEIGSTLIKKEMFLKSAKLGPNI